MSCSINVYLLNLRGFTGTASQIIELSASDFTLSHDLDMVDLGRMQGESSFHADTVRNLSDGEGLSDGAVSASDDDTVERLKSFLVTFDDLNVNLYAVAYAKIGKIGSHSFFFNQID